MAKKKPTLSQQSASQILRAAGAGKSQHGNVSVTGDLRASLRERPKDEKLMEALRISALKELELSEKRLNVMQKKAGTIKDPFLRRELIRREQAYQHKTEQLAKFTERLGSAKYATTKSREATYVLGYLESVQGYREGSYRISKSDLSRNVLAGIAGILNNSSFWEIPHSDLMRIVELSQMLSVPTASRFEQDYEDYRNAQLPSESLVQDVYDIATEFKEMQTNYEDNEYAQEFYDLLTKYHLM